MKLEFYHWKEVMGNNMVQPTSDMLYGTVPIQRKTRLKSEGFRTPMRLMNVYYDKDFIKWRFSQLLRNFEKYDSGKLDEILQSTLYEVFQEPINNVQISKPNADD